MNKTNHRVASTKKHIDALYEMSHLVLTQTLSQSPYRHRIKQFADNNIRIRRAIAAHKNLAANEVDRLHLIEGVPILLHKLYFLEHLSAGSSLCTRCMSLHDPESSCPSYS